MNVFIPAEFEAITGGRWLQQPTAGLPTQIHGFGTDTRDDLTGRAFIALRGNQHDGHDYLNAAVRAGATVLIVDREPSEVALPDDAAILLVPETRRALADFARTHRRSLTDTTVIAITGSCGKTSTKSLMHSVLSQSLRGTCARKSFNNEVGVPLTLLAASPEDHYLIVEVGTNAPGEIAHLASIVEPDIAIITMIGRSHLEGLGSIEAVVHEKCSLMGALRSAGTAILNGDTPALRTASPPNATVITFGESAGAAYRLTAYERVEDDQDRWRFDLAGGRRFDLPLPGRHQALNALAAIAVADRLGVDNDAIAAGLLAATLEGMRWHEERIGETRLINDAYNANPDSMLAALKTFRDLDPAARVRVLVLGDMLELGTASSELHLEVLRAVCDLHDAASLSALVLVGPHFAHAAQSTPLPDIPLCIVPALTPDTIEAILPVLRRADLALVKGSRGIALERLIDALRSRAADAPRSDAAAPSTSDCVVSFRP